MGQKPGERSEIISASEQPEILQSCPVEERVRIEKRELEAEGRVSERAENN